MKAIVTVKGNVGAHAPTSRVVGQGTELVEFSLAVSESREETRWFDITVWNEFDRRKAMRANSGDVAVVIGELSHRESNGKVYSKISARQVYFFRKGSEVFAGDGGGGAPHPRREEREGREERRGPPPQQQSRGSYDRRYPDDSDQQDDIPF